MKNTMLGFLCALAVSAAVCGQEEQIYFAFDEGAGTTAKDAAGNSSVPVKRWDANGKSGAAMLLDGTLDTVAALQKKKDIGMSDVTVAFWMKPADITFADLKDKRRRIINVVDNYPEVWCAIDIREGGAISIEIGQKKNGGPNAGSTLISKPAALVNEWVHAAVVINRGLKKMLIYINGVFSAEKEMKSEFDAALTAVKPASIGAGFQNFKGSIDEVKMYLKALDEDGVKSSMTSFYQGVTAPAAAVKQEERPVIVKPAQLYYVAVDGNDAWSGTLSAPNAANTDGPLATLNGAKEMLRSLKSQGNFNAPVTVYLRGGTYRVKETITFTPDDSGTKDTPITYAAYKNETPVISGGSAITTWRVNGSILETDIPLGIYFQELYVNGKRAIRSRHPNEGYFRIVEPGAYVAPPGTHQNHRKYYEEILKPEDIRQWENISDVNLYLFHSWNASIHWLESVDLGKNTVKFANPNRSQGFCSEKNARYYLENCIEGYDAPGEWYLNRKTGLLQYMLRPGETAAHIEVIAPRIGRILDFKGDPSSGAFIEYLSFQGITFSHTDWGFAPPLEDNQANFADGQAGAMLRYASIYARGLRNTTFERCEISHGGAHAVWFENGCSDNTVRQCHIFDHGGGGVYIGSTKVPPEADMRTARITVDNCFMHALNYVIQGAHGVWIGRSSQNIITHNEISDINYSPIGVGWTWGYGQPSGALSNIIEYNHLHHYGLGELSDMGGIYTLGIATGTKVRFNHIHDGNAYSYGGWGLYTDEGTSDIVMEKNLVYNTKSGGLHQHYGSNNTYRNNIFAFAAEANIISKRSDAVNKSMTFEKNIVLTTNRYMLNTGFNAKQFVLDNNIYWDLNEAGEDGLNFSGKTFSDWKSKMGYDMNSIIADPLFIDAVNYDFRIKEGSPALQKGFEPFLDEIAKAGLYGDGAWKDLPKKFTPRTVSRYMQPSPKILSMHQFSEDMENVAPAVPPPFGKADAGILTSGEQAYKSKHSIKFQDADNLAAEWRPILSLYQGFKPGMMKASFDVYLEEGAIVWHEWREKTATGYAAGPAITINASGDVIAGGEKVTSVPRDTWIHIEITAATGGKSGSWDLAVTVDGGNRTEFNNLKASAGLNALDWVIWSSMATRKTVFYIDNVTFEVQKK
ncbi:MAG: right-handed parallel beta-helix repeat-containing protein [Spirochaetes bacterium]|nr:right-handed parallel beta-helix repeat-containing protein [Spirochaetota bacterium]